MHLARQMRVRGEAALEPVGLKSRHLIALTVLRDHGGTTQAALATTLGVDRTNLVGLLNDLEGEGLIARRRSEEDRRRHLVELTATGIRRLAKAEFALAAAEDEVLAGLDHAEREQLYALLVRATSEACAPAAGACDGTAAEACAAAAREGE